MTDEPKLTVGDIDLSPMKNSFVFTISRDQAIMYGHVKPTPEEVAEYNAASRLRWEKSVADWAVMDVVLARLDEVSEPLARKILDLHECAADEAVCYACSFDSDDPLDERWPCPTVRVVASHVGVELPDGYLGSRPDDSPHEMPPEGYTPFVPPVAKWHEAMDGSIDLP